MATDSTIASLFGCCVGHRHRFLAIHTFRTDQMQLVTGMHIMTGQAGDSSFFTGMQVVQIVNAITEGILLCFLIRYQRLVMAFETHLLYRGSQLEFKVRDMWSMAPKAVIFHDRRMDAFFAGLVFVTLITHFGTLVLDAIDTMVGLMIAPGYGVTGGTLFTSQPAVNEWSGDFAAVTFCAELSTYGINGAL